MFDNVVCMALAVFAGLPRKHCVICLQAIAPCQFVSRLHSDGICLFYASNKGSNLKLCITLSIEDFTL